MPDYLYYRKSNFAGIQNNDADYVIYIKGTSFSQWIVPGTISAE